jgi:hypothetical protein
MASPTSINYRDIAPRLGGPDDAFEELCCQIARKMCRSDSTFERYRGSGGDGGVECIERRSSGAEIGWQAKFIFKVGKLIGEADKSLNTALAQHPSLTEFILCFPFVRTTATGKGTKREKARSELEKLNDWKARRETAATKAGRTLKIEFWPADLITSLLLEHDPKGGIREYFFNATILSDEWFRQHIEEAALSTKPRYTPELRIDTPLHQVFDAFVCGPLWRTEFECRLQDCTEHLAALFNQDGGSTLNPTKVFARANAAISLGAGVLVLPSPASWQRLGTTTNEALACLHEEFANLNDEDESETRRSIEKAIESFSAFSEWLTSRPANLAVHQTLVLRGEGGSGKTHGICDMALRRLDHGGYSCITFGHQYRGDPTDWERFALELGFQTIDEETLWGALEAASEASGQPLIIWVDAINETLPRSYWRDRLIGFAESITRRPSLRFCVSCRSSFERACLPDGHGFAVVEHQGFRGIEEAACKAFFEHYGLTPPLSPVLQPELGNPLYLRLVCSTLQKRGLKQLPHNWLGLSVAITAFLDEMEKQFRKDHPSALETVGIVRRCLLVIAREQMSGGGVVRSIDAIKLLATHCPYVPSPEILHWLVKSDLLIENGSGEADIGIDETFVRLAFERLSDFLIASDLLQCCRSVHDLKSSKAITQLLCDPNELNHNTLYRNGGIVESLCALVADRWKVELPLLFQEAPTKRWLLTQAAHALSRRSPESFTSQTQLMVEGIFREDWRLMTDAWVRVAPIPSCIDTLWLHRRMSGMPSWERDPCWCKYLHDSISEYHGEVEALMTASSRNSVAEMDSDIVLRWAVMLCWFTVAADRRVKDGATRALTRVLAAHPSLIIELVALMEGVHDDDLLERTLLAAYGALILSRHGEATKQLAEVLLTRYSEAPERFDNALIRDLIRCIAELAKHLRCLPAKFDPLLPTKRRKTNWEILLPTETQMQEWLEWKNRDTALQRAAHSCADDDFNHYTIGCLSPWMEKMGKKQIGRWLTQHLIQEFHIDDSAFDDYDKRITNRYGAGRDREVWAERIGKKYQWVALFRLASRLHDRFHTKRDSWHPKPVHQPLILQEERKIDPTLPSPNLPNRAKKDCWWIPAHMDLKSTKTMPFRDWMRLRDDLPTMESLLAPITNEGQAWRLLHTLMSWGEYDPNTQYRTPYRDSWLHLRSYLVPMAQFDDVAAAISSRSYFNRWLPEGGGWLHCFLGEYPWATPFNTEPDSYLGAESKLRDTDLTLIHTANRINGEWQYDGTLPRSIEYLVPSKSFFKTGGLRWNNEDGYIDLSGKTIFRDPHGTEGGKAGLIVDAAELPKLLTRLGFRLVWTLLGGKSVLGDYNYEDPRESYSQFAHLAEDGTVVVGERRFFKERDGESTGPDPKYLRPTPKPRIEFSADTIRFNW